MNCLKFILCVLFLVFGTVRGWASAAATLTNHNLVYFQIDALPTAIPTNVIMLTGNLTNWQKLVTNVICNPCLTINPTDTYIPYRLNATTFEDSPISRLATNILTIASGTNQFLWVSDPSTFALGYQAAGDRLLGANSIAIGQSAMERANSESQSIAIGTTTLRDSFGSDNVAVGYRAMLTSTSANNSVAIGAFTLDAVLSGYDNTGVGVESLSACTTGNNNTAYGYKAGLTITTGSTNVFIGTKADAVSAGLTNLIVIGPGVKGTNSNEIVIGNTANTAAIFPITSYTGTGTNYLSDDGTFKPCCAPAGLTINPSDTFVPYRINGTTFGDSWWHYYTDGMGIDTNTFYGPGKTNWLARSTGADTGQMALWGSASTGPETVRLEFHNPNHAIYSWIGGDKLGGIFGTTGNNSSWTTASQGLYQVPGYTAAGTDNTMDLGNRGVNFKTIHERTNFVYWFHDNTDTNNVRTEQSMDGTLAIINVTSKTNQVDGPVTGLEIQTNGVKLFRIPSTIWVDSMVPQSAVRNGSTAPTTAAFAGGPASTLMFQNNRDDTVEFSVQLNHNYKQGTDISPHVHWCETAATGAGTNVVWELTYTWQNVNGVFGAYNTLYTTNYVTTTNWFHQLSEFPDISGSGKTVSSILVCQLKRLANSATADDYDQNVAFLGCDIHYQVDSPGSDSELIKSF